MKRKSYSTYFMPSIYFHSSNEVSSEIGVNFDLVILHAHLYRPPSGGKVIFSVVSVSLHREGGFPYDHYLAMLKLVGCSLGDPQPLPHGDLTVQETPTPPSIERPSCYLCV